MFRKKSVCFQLTPEGAETMVLSHKDCL